MRIIGSSRFMGNVKDRPRRVYVEISLQGGEAHKGVRV